MFVSMQKLSKYLVSYKMLIQNGLLGDL